MARPNLIAMAVLAVLSAGAVAAGTGTAVLRGTAKGSALAGEAVLKETHDGLEVIVRVTGAPPGQHGIHIHEFGECGDAGNAAGGHFNPRQAPHGFFPEHGPEHAHPGDLGNITVGPDGSGELSRLLLPGVTLRPGPLSVAGRAIIVHEKPDDFGQPTGNAGGRIACGRITAGAP